MHERARGHEVEHSHSHFLCLKTKKKQNKGEAQLKSHARTCKRTRGRAQSLSFFISKNNIEAKQGRKASREESCTNVQEDTRSSAVTLIFYVQKRKELKTR